MLTRIISITNPIAAGVHSKFVRRLTHVESVLMPSLRAIGLEPEIFPAILGSSLHAEGGKVQYRGITLTLGYGCTGNLLSNYELWRLSAESGEPVLVLEDDALLPPANSESLRVAVGSFINKCSENDALYLLGESPSVNGLLKSYHPSQLERFSDDLNRLRSGEDLSCTAAYVVTPGAARVLIERLDKSPTLPTDGYLHAAFRDGAVGIVVQADPTKGFMLNENFAEWNHKHDPEVFK